jgi:AcrR family transcriptional regulator
MKPLSRERILDVALSIVDKEGLDALSMRRLGDALGVEAMSLYNHVPNKQALLDGIHERILSSVEAPPRTDDWKVYARHQARSLHKTLCAHPNAVVLFATRPAGTTESYARLDAYLEMLRAAGFMPTESRSVIQIVLAFVVGLSMWTVGTADPSDRELEIGLDALLTGLESLRGKRKTSGKQR